ncbi:MAG: hypothetical protein AABX14_00160 [Candidatus Aenigmatarchaeota archaeon]
MISVEEQQTLFLNISRKLNEKMIVYAVGGTAMTFLGLKDATLDVDIVLETERDRGKFEDAIKSLGYQAIDSTVVYGAGENHPRMFTLGDNRFDLFVGQVVSFIFSENMRARAVHTYQYDNNLILKIADPHDIILMKCATDRLKDKDDVRKIIESREINWDIIIDEANNQIVLGRKKAMFELGYFLEDLREKMNVNKIPKSVVDRLFESFQNNRNQ